MMPRPASCALALIAIVASGSLSLESRQIQGRSAPPAVSGKVLTRAGTPVRRARVILKGPATITEYTDTEGAFAVADAPLGSYRVVVRKPGLVPAEAADIVTVSPARPAIATITMQAGGVIVGHAVSTRDVPFVGVQVLLSLAHAPVADEVPIELSATTDDQGAFRFHTLPIGDYIVAVAPSFFYPGGGNREDAEVIHVDAGETKDIRMVMPSGIAPEPPSASQCRPGQSDEPAAGDGRIAGRITRGKSTQPAAFVQVGVGRLVEQGGIRFVLGCTNGEGAFEFRGLAAGSYFVQAAYGPQLVAGLGNVAFGQTSPTDPMRAITIGAGEAFTQANIAVSVPATLAGHVRDEFGDPAPDVTVGVFRPALSLGKVRWIPLSPGVVTNDLGEYRVNGVPAGSYCLIALSGPFSTGNLAAGPSGPQAEGAGFAITYFPGTAIPGDAQLVQVVGDGLDVSREFSLIPAALGSVIGRVVKEDGQPSSQTDVMLWALHGGDVRVAIPARATTAADGTFLFRNVPAGSYAVQTYSPAGFASQVIAPQGLGQSNVSLTTAPAVVIRGRLVFDDPGDRPSFKTVAITAVPTDFVSGPAGRIGPRSTIQDDGSFGLDGVIGPNRLSFTAAPPWTLQAVYWRGRDITDSAIDSSAGDISDVEVHFVRRSTTIAGHLGDSSGRPAPGFVVMLPSNPALWSAPSRFVRGVAVDKTGSFQVLGLPPSTYWAVPFPASPRLDWMNPEFLATLVGRGEQFAVVDGGAVTIQLRLGGGR